MCDNERVAQALEPFAKLADKVPDEISSPQDWKKFLDACTNIETSDLRRAKEMYETLTQLEVW